jgi:uncharacterized ferritin-like protein (DUF455 family)
MMELRERALEALCHDTWQAKAACLKSLSQSTPLDTARIFLASADIPGRPAIKLVPPAQLGLRSVHTLEGRAILIHALAHIEFNAINLALDVLWRFANMPDKFYYDWLQVAQEECEHFGLLKQHLQTLGHQYGDFSGHDGLWEMAERTQDDVLARLALVPRTLEARGLDASPAVRHKLASGGDPAGAAIIDIILRDEIGHVAIGNHWYRWLCTERGLDPIKTYAELATTYRAPKLKGPFNIEARLAAGFEAAEIALL